MNTNPITTQFESWCADVEAHASKRCALLNWHAVQFHWSGLFCKGYSPKAAAIILVEEGLRQVLQQSKEAE